MAARLYGEHLAQRRRPGNAARWSLSVPEMPLAGEDHGDA